MKSLTTIIVVTVLLLSSVLDAQTTKYSYISPVPSSKFINPEQTITLKTGFEFNRNTIDENKFSIKGSLSGTHSFEVNLMNDMKTLIIVPDKHFLYGENVDIIIKPGIKTKTGININALSFSFTIKPCDNLPLLIDFYEREAANEESIINEPIGLTSNYRGTLMDNNLPADYPVPEMHNYQETDNRVLFYTLSPRAGAPQFSNYLSINDEYGTPVFFRKTSANTLYFHKMENGQLAFAKNESGNPEKERYFFMDSSYVILDSVKTGNGYNMDGHDILLMDNGHYLLMSYDPQPVDMSEMVIGGNPNATVIGLVIQEVDLNENVYFQWRSWDHFAITDATDDINLQGLSIDYVHGNAFAFDTDGNLLLSSRHLDEITKINYQTGDIIYRFGLLSKNNEFTIQNDNYGFSHQHDIRVLPNGNITIFDNGNLHPFPFSRALEYSINESNMTAELQWFYRNDPDIYGAATGSYRRDPLGKHLIGWGSAWPVAATELLPNNTKSFEVYLPTGVYSYRTVKYEWKTNLFKSLPTLNLGNYSGGEEPKQIILPIHNSSENQIRITSLHLHNETFSLDDEIPVVLFANDTINVIVSFLPSDTGSFSDRLTLNYDRFSLTGTERIAIQVELSGLWDPLLPIVSFTPEFNAQNVDPNTSISIDFSEPVKKNNGEMIQDSDIPNLFSIKLHNKWGQEIPFTGTVSDDFMNIELFPNEHLTEYESYYVELKESVIEDFEGIHIDYPETTFFTTGTLVGNNLQSANRNIMVFPSPFSDNLKINFPSHRNNSIYIYNITGSLIFEKHNIDNEISLVTLDYPAGIYIISTTDILGNREYFKAIKY